MHTDKHIFSAYLQTGLAVGCNSLKLLVFGKGVLKLT